jgi:hypothetical protein
MACNHIFCNTLPGNQISMISIGQSTNMEAVYELLENNAVTTNYFAVIKDCFDWNSERLHLQNIFQIENSNKGILLEKIAKTWRRRLVDVFKKDEKMGYSLLLNSVDFLHFLKLNLQLDIELSSGDSLKYNPDNNLVGNTLLYILIYE